MRKRTFPSTVQEDRCITGDKNVAVYAMIDTDDTYMLNAQIQELSAYASSHPDLVGWNIVIYQDSGNSSKAGKQPQLKQLIADIRDGKIQCIIVKNLSRILFKVRAVSGTPTKGSGSLLLRQIIRKIIVAIKIAKATINIIILKFTFFIILLLIIIGKIH